MSRVGLRPIALPKDVTVEMKDNIIHVKGPKGELSREIPECMDVTITDEEIKVNRPNDLKEMRALHGTTRAHINNMVEGVNHGFKKTLILQGVGYRAQAQGKKLTLNVGLSHPAEFEVPEGLSLDMPSNTEINIEGIDKEQVGAFAANVRQTRLPEPYKGKGIRYSDEHIIRKEGKTGK